MPTRKSFTFAFDPVDPEPGFDVMAAVFNRATDPATLVAISEVRASIPGGFNDDATNLTGNQGIVAIERITAATGGTLVAATKHDTGASDLPSQVECRLFPTALTISGGTLRRFGDVVSTYTILKTVNFQAMMRAPGICDTNDHSGRTAEGQDVWHADGLAATEPIVLAAGEGIGLVRRAWGIPQSTHFTIVARVVSTGKTYRWRVTDSGTAGSLGTASVTLMNNSGSGISLQVYVISFPDMGEENIPRYRLVKVGGFEGGSYPVEVPVIKHDTSLTIDEAKGYAGPAVAYAVSKTHGVPVTYLDYQSGVGNPSAVTAIQQKYDCYRQWLGCGPYMGIARQPNLIAGAITRGDYEVWPGDRRGAGDAPEGYIILRQGEGLALVAGGGGLIETSELAYLWVEFQGFVYLPDVASGGVSRSRVVNK